MLLLDPVNLEITTVITDEITNLELDPSPAVVLFNNVNGSEITPTTIQDQLLISNVELQAQDDITVTSSITEATGNNLTLTAGDSILFNGGDITLGTSSSTTLALNYNSGAFGGGTGGVGETVSWSASEVLTAHTVTITNGLGENTGGDLSLGEIVATNLNVSTAGEGAITDGAALLVTGLTTLTAGSVNDITLNDAANDFSALSIISGNNVSLTDATGIVIGTSTVSGTLAITTTNGAITDSGNVSVVGNTTLTDTNFAGITLDTLQAGSNVILVSAGNSAITNSAALNLEGTVTGTLGATTTSGDITDSGELNVSAAATFTSADNTNILLDSTSNTFDTTVSFAASSGTLNDVTIVDDSILDLQLLSIGGNLDATGAGITQSGALTIVGTTSLTSTGAGNDILLAGTNDFGTSLSLTTDVAVGSDATLIDTTSVSLAASSIGGLLDLTAPGIDITGAVSAASLDLDASGGTLTDTTGSLSVAGNAALTVTGTSVLTLDNVTNEFATVLLNSGSGTATIVDATAVDLGASVLGGDLNITATTLDITDSGSVDVTGDSVFTVAADQNITLDTAANTFTGSLSFVASSGTLNDVTIVDDSVLDLQLLSIGGNLDATGAGITQSGALTIVGTTSLTSTGAGNDILLAGTNDFGTSLSLATDVAAGSDATLIDTTSVSLAASSIGGLLDLTAPGIDLTGAVSAASLDLDASGGTLTDTTGSLSVAGNAALTVTGTSVLTLDNVTNEFATVLLNSGSGTATIVDATAVDLGASVLGGDLNITATTLDITDSGSVDVTGDSVFTVAADQNITLDTAANTFTGSLSFVASSGTLNDVTIVDDSVLDLQLLSIGGNLDATGAGITQSGALTIVGTTSLTSTGAGNDILLAGTNDFGTSLSLTTDVAVGSDATLIDTTSVSLAASSIGGLLDLTAPGIDLTGAVSAASLDLDASGGTLTDTTGSLSVAGNAAVNSDRYERVNPG